MPELTQHEKERVREIARRFRIGRPICPQCQSADAFELARDVEYLLGLLNEAPPTRIPVKLL